MCTYYYLYTLFNSMNSLQGTQNSLIPFLFLSSFMSRVPVRALCHFSSNKPQISWWVRQIVQRVHVHTLETNFKVVQLLMKEYAIIS
jgi:hypothetical protein